MSLKLPRNWDFSTLRAEKMARSRSIMPGEGSPKSLIRRSLEKPAKSGWLKKQRSIVKNWQLRYFVLRGNILTYYKDDRESTSQGTIPLWSCQVNELSSNDDKFLFEIIRPSSGDRERDPYVLMARTQAEKDEWVRSIRRVIGARSSGVFGKSLSDMMTYEKRFGQHTVPILVTKCADFLREHGLNEEGIFRLPGQENQVKQFRDAFDAGERPSFPSDTDVHTVGSLLKLYLRELPEPVVPWSQYQDFLDCSGQVDASTALGKECLEKQIALLPRTNYNLLSYICRFLHEVGENSKVNKMSVENLATVIGVNVFKPQMEDAISMMKGTPQIQKVMTVMIRHHELLFPKSKDVTPSPPPARSKKSKKSSGACFVGWESAEADNSSLSESPEEEDAETDRTDGWGSDDRTPPPSGAAPTSPTSPSSDEWDQGPGQSPRKRTQTLPNLNRAAVPGRLSRDDSMFRWSRIQESDERDEKTLSEDIFKILDLQGMSSPTQDTKKEEEEKEKEKEKEEKKKKEETLKSSPVAAAAKDSEGGSPKVSTAGLQPARPSPANATGSPKTHYARHHDLQTVREEPVGADTTPSPQHTAADGHHQHGISNSRHIIDSLQLQNQELVSKVSELQSALDAERRCVAALEIRLRNAERSRDEAQRRNRELDQEIQAFLSPGGPP
ncbi:rho GTPase-activating protein 25 isoform X2 [Engraulis encrasicolus]|uniref:rho GTPase-activating protein 25 isoform X2 n=1 Tax=Engraulis encrasicolus TaxID=184585 RepID=UPI002FCF3088